MVFWKRFYRSWQKRRLALAEFAFLFDEPDANEVVCFDCETSGLNPKQDKILSISAIKIRGNEILTSESLNLVIKRSQVTADSIKVHHLRLHDIQNGLEEREAIAQFLHFIGSRPLVGYFLEFDVAMVNQVIQPWLGIRLPNPQIEISALYYQQYRHPYLPKNLDLSFEAILRQLNLPNMGQHDAFNDALMTALCYLKLQST